MNKIKFLNYLLIVSLFLTVISVTSCNKEETIVEKEVTTIPVEPVFDKTTPVFPAWVSHVLQREFYYQKSQKQTNLDYYRYIENRLMN